MILSIPLPQMGERMQYGTVHRVIARPGDALLPGSPLLEIRVDLEETRAQDCPPMFFFRLIARERAFIRTFAVAKGDVIRVGGLLGTAATSPEEFLGTSAARSLRCTSVSIQVDPLST